MGAPWARRPAARTAWRRRAPLPRPPIAAGRARPPAPPAPCSATPARLRTHPASAWSLAPHGVISRAHLRTAVVVKHVQQQYHTRSITQQVLRRRAARTLCRQHALLERVSLGGGLGERALAHRGLPPHRRQLRLLLGGAALLRAQVVAQPARPGSQSLRAARAARGLRARQCAGGAVRRYLVIS